MVKISTILLVLCVISLEIALAEDPSPIPPPSPITPGGAPAPAALTQPASSPGTMTPAATTPIPLPAAAAPAIPAPTDAASPEQPAPIEPPVNQPSFMQPDQSAAPIAPGAVPTPGVSAVTPATPATPAETTTTAAAPVPRMVNEFQGDDINQVFRLLARQAKISVLISDKVQGTVTTRLENVGPLQAIEIIANSKNLIFEEQSGIYYIKTQDEKKAEPLVTGNYTFSYSVAGKVKEILDRQLGAGTSQVDERTNTVFYTTPKSNLQNVKLFLETIDKPTKQVMIEARLVEVTANPQQSYGINWAGVVGSASAPQTVTYGAAIPGSASTTTATGAFALGDGNNTNFLKSLTHLGALATGQIAILSVPQMSIAMQFLNEDQDAEFLANPRIVTASNQKATIKITRNQPVPSLNFNEQTATAVFGGFSDKTYGNTLVVTPNINKDNFITLLVQPEISNKVADATFTFSGATVASPIIDTRSLESNVLIKSGDTLAIGGLLQDELTKTRNKVPLLGDIPVIGYAFQSRQNVRTKRNLLIFVTPTIIQQGYGTGLEDQVSGLNHSGEEFADPDGWRNNAKGSYRLLPTSHRGVTPDYPKPGNPPPPDNVSYKVNASDREQ
jgi:type IV pilus secretin PilQ/predicted competence protein